jgi:hypothetical protein
VQAEILVLRNEYLKNVTRQATGTPASFWAMTGHELLFGKEK